MNEEISGDERSSDECDLLDLPKTIIPAKNANPAAGVDIRKRNSSGKSCVDESKASTAKPSCIPMGKQRPLPLSQFALHYLVLCVRETGRRLAMSDLCIARASTLLHRTLCVLITGWDHSKPIFEEEGQSLVNDASFNVKDPEIKVKVSQASIISSFKGSLGEVDPHSIAMACLNLAGKIQEEHQRMRDVILSYHRTLHPVVKGEKPILLDAGEEYENLRETLVKTELLIMRLLSFNVREPNLPHSYLLHYLSSLLHWIGTGHPIAPHKEDSADSLARLPGLAWSILCDSYHSSLCLQFSPEHIAVSILHLALRIAGIEVPGNRHSESAWWQSMSSTISRDIVEKVQLRIMQIYAVDDAFRLKNPIK